MIYSASWQSSRDFSKVCFQTNEVKIRTNRRKTSCLATGLESLMYKSLLLQRVQGMRRLWGGGGGDCVDLKLSVRLSQGFTDQVTTALILRRSCSFSCQSLRAISWEVEGTRRDRMILLLLLLLSACRLVSAKCPWTMTVDEIVPFNVFRKGDYFIAGLVASVLNFLISPTFRRPPFLLQRR